MSVTFFVPVTGRQTETPLETLEAIAEARLRKLQLQLKGVGETGFIKDVILAVRELADQREKLVKLEELKKYAQHTDECTFVLPVMILNEEKFGQPCNCGFAELLTKLGK